MRLVSERILCIMNLLPVIPVALPFLEEWASDFHTAVHLNTAMFINHQFSWTALCFLFLPQCRLGRWCLTTCHFFCFHTFLCFKSGTLTFHCVRRFSLCVLHCVCFWMSFCVNYNMKVRISLTVSLLSSSPSGILSSTDSSRKWLLRPKRM